MNGGNVTMKKVSSIVFIFLMVGSILPIEKTYQNTRKVKFAFTLSEMRPFLKVKRIILWVTEDDGINWYEADKFNLKRNENGENYIEWDAPKDGDFGFMLSYELEGLRKSPKPSLFDLPQYIVSVDTKPPKVIYFRARYINRRKGVLKLQWKVVDKNLRGESLKLLYKKNGEFQVVSDNMPSEGETIWYITDFSQKYVRFSLDAADLAGNRVTKIITRRNSRFIEKIKVTSLTKKPPEQAKEEEKIEVVKSQDSNVKLVKEDTSSEQSPIIEKAIVKGEEENTKTVNAPPLREKEKRVIPVRIPLKLRGDRNRLLSIVVYYTSDKGKHWQKYYELSPYEDYLTFYAEKENLYGFYFVFRTKDNISFPDEPKPGDVPKLYKYIDITAPKVKLYTPSTNVLIGGMIYKIGWKIYDKNLDRAQSKLKVSYDGGHRWHLLAKSIPKKGRITFRAPQKDAALLFKLEAQDFSGLSSSIVSKLYTVRKYDFDISFSEISKQKNVKVIRKRAPKNIKAPPAEVKIAKPTIDRGKIEQLLKESKILISQGEYYNALQNLKQIIQEDFNNMEALSLMGYIHTLQENYTESIKVLSHAFTVDCSDFTNFYNLEIGLIKVNNIFDSVSKLINFLKCVPPDSLDKNKKKKLDTIISVLSKKSDALSDNTVKSKLNYVRSLYTTPALESVHK